MADEVPKLFSDDEFKAQLESREQRQVPDRPIEEWREEPVQFGPRPSDRRPESTLEQQFPRIAQKLTATWRSEACAAYLSSLTVADRPDRQGFPAEVMEDLMMLYEINEMLMEKSRLGPEAASPPAWREAVRRERE